jgi:hypothetical protein
LEDETPPKSNVLFAVVFENEASTSLGEMYLMDLVHPDTRRDRRLLDHPEAARNELI